MADIYSPRKNKRRRVGFFILFGFLLLLTGGGIFAYSLIQDLPRPERITERSVIESTKIYDRTGKVLLYEIHGEEKRTIIPLINIPEHVRAAAIAAEDGDFYNHRGLDWKGILRATTRNIIRGNIEQGGSTITQQLVKNSVLTGERTFRRKIKEAFLAILVENKYSKDEILELYLNQIPYGSNAYGLAAAAETYFAKPVEELNLAEAALLAALPRAPSYYSPYGSHKNELLGRKDWVLERMAGRSVAQEEVDRAKKISLVFAPPKQSIRAPHFVFYVRDYLNEKYGEEFVERGGLRVITTLDWKLQEEAEKIVREGANANEKLVKAANAALVALDPKTGEIIALVGSKDYWGHPEPEGCTPGVTCRFDPHVNITTRSRQPGSAFKPFVYATAFKKGYTPETVLFDIPTEFNPLCNPDGTPGEAIRDEKECYHPQNYDEKFRGPVSLRQALAQSLNVPSVKLLYLAGVEDSIKTAREMGINTLTDPTRYGLSLVLGGAEVTLLEMASAFGAFSQEGILHPKISVLRIENSKGVVLEEKKYSSLPVIDTEVARTLNDLLSDNDSRIPIFSPQSSLYFPGRQVAAKTGTTQDFRDAWVIGYTPSVVAGVWVGNNDNSPMNQSGLSVMVAGPIWHKFLVFAFQRILPEEFTKPAPQTAEKPALRGLYRSGPTVKIDKISKKLATSFTPYDSIEELSFGEITTILAQIKKSDPTGPPPQDPNTDPQFKNWQNALNKWLGEHVLPRTEPPKDYDDVHTPEKRPQITLLLADSVEAPLAAITAQIKTSFPLREVSLFINGELVGSKTAPILGERINFILNDPLGEGTYQIKIAAYDAVGNKELFEKTLGVVK